MTSTLVDSQGNPPIIRRGTTKTLRIAVKNPDGSAKNLTGATEASFFVASDRIPLERDIHIPLNSGVSHDGTGGNLTVVLTPVQTESLPRGGRWCEVWITDSDGRRDVAGEGDCLVYDTLGTVP